MISAEDLRDVLVVGLTVAATLWAWRHSLGAALAVLFAALVASNSSVGWLKEPFLGARWAALLTVALLLAWRLRSLPRDAVARWAPLSIAAGVALASAAWSVDPRLTAGRAASFAVLLFVAAGTGIVLWLDERERAPVIDGIAIVAAGVFVASAVAWFVKEDSYYVGDFRGVLENQNGLGLLLGLTYPFVCGALEQRGLGSWRVGPFAAVAAVCAISGSRSGAGALLITGIGYELVRGRLTTIFLFPAAGLACALAALALIAAPGVGEPGGPRVEPAPPGLFAALGSRPDRPDIPGPRDPTPAPVAVPEPSRPFATSLTGGRDEAWRATLSLIEEKPVLGYGFGTGDRLFERYPEHTDFLWFFGSAPHNGYLHAVLELGVLGLVLLVPLLGAGVLAVRLLLRDDSLPATCASLALIAGLAAGMVESAFFSAGAPWAFLVWTSAAMCVGLTLANAGSRAVAPAPVPGRTEPTANRAAVSP